MIFSAQMVAVNHPDLIDLADIPLRALAERLARRELGASELLDAHIALIQRVDPAVNALVVPLLDRAVEAAREADRRAPEMPLGPLAGIPFTVKECFDVAGVDTTIGVPALRGRPAETDAVLVARLRAAGAVLLGKTNLPQLMWFNECDNPVFGRTSNPWDLGRTPGGSSGGEAAIVAFGGSPLGFGTDSGGSIRVPAHFCGVHTLKPTDGRLSLRGTADERLLAGQEGIVDTPGPFARRVDDLALAMEVLTSPSLHGADSRIAPVGWRDPAEVEVSGLRVGVYTGGTALEPVASVRRVVLEAAGVLEERGAGLEKFEPPEPELAKRFYDRIFSADGGTGLERLLGAGPRDWRIERMLAAMREAGPLSAGDWFALVAERSSYRERFLRLMDERRLDAIVCAPFPRPALLHESSADADLQAAEIACAVFNIAGLPAGVVAASTVGAGEDGEGLPVGVQVAARHWRDDVVLALMGVLESHFRDQPGYPSTPRAVVEA
jgi:Asp-tRNA(Asn)/Glu-tRNA(Gln) amidotransferase A subunit family amidase